MIALGDDRLDNLEISYSNSETAMCSNLGAESNAYQSEDKIFLKGADH